MEFPVRLEGPAAAEYLSGHRTVRDGWLLGLTVNYFASKPVIHLNFKAADGRLVMLDLDEIVEFNCAYEAKNASEQIEFVKCFWTKDGEFYLSLDPYDEREIFVSDKDNDCFRARSVVLTASL